MLDSRMHEARAQRVGRAGAHVPCVRRTMTHWARAQQLTFLAITGDPFLASAIDYVLVHEFDATRLGCLTRPQHLAGWPAPLAPHVVVIDGRRCDPDAVTIVQSCHDIRARWPGASVVVVADVSNDAKSDGTSDGTSGHAGAPRSCQLHHAVTVEHLIDRLRSTAYAIHQRHPGGALVAGAHPTGRRPARAPLSDREWQVVALLSEGCCNKEIARALAISLATAKNHVHHILEKLGVERRGQIVARIQLSGSERHRGDAYLP
jgi:DNA-binding NarL/FixJ family response regulator